MPGGDDRAEERTCDGDAIRAFVSAGGGYYGTCAGAFAGCTNVAVSVDRETGQYKTWNATAQAEPLRFEDSGKPVYPEFVELGSTFKLSSTYCYAYWHVGTSHHQWTEEGHKAFPHQSDGVAIDHHNGPAMDERQATRLATFTDGEFKGKASIVGDTYGKGKVILVSPHPEHDKLQNCDQVTYMAAYAAGIDVSAYINV